MITEFFLICHQRTIIKYNSTECPGRPGWYYGSSPELIWGQSDDIYDTVEICQDEPDFFLCSDSAMLILLNMHQEQIKHLLHQKNQHLEQVRLLVKTIYGISQESN